MKEADDFSGSRIDGRNVGTLVTIAKYAAESQIVQSGTPAMFAAYNMVQLMREGRPRFRKQAILAARLRTGANLLPYYFR